MSVIVPSSSLIVALLITRRYLIHYGVIRWRISTSEKVVERIFAISHTVSEIYMFEIDDLENLGQSHEI